MIKLKLNNETFTLPETWSEVTLGLYQRLAKVEPNENKLQYTVDIIKALTGLEEKIIININKNQFKEIVDAISFIYIEKMEDKFTSSFNIGEDVYTMKEFNSLSMGDVVSLETLIDKGDNLANAHQIIAILFRKNGEAEFNFDELESRGKEIQDNIQMNIVNKILLFFFDYVKNYTENLKAYLEYKEKERMKMVMKNQPFLIRASSYLKSFFGSHWSRGSQWVTSQNTKKSTKRTSYIA